MRCYHVKKIIDFFGLRSDSPEDGPWYGIDRQLKAKLISMSLLLAVAVYVVSYYLFRGIDIFPVILPWSLAVLAFCWSLAITKNKFTDSRGADD